jgi:S-adenosylmethionine:tRNA-ribosyltransferase-isomerase (queuine synthetase)
VVNETRVIPARIFAHKQPGGGKVELLLLEKEDPTTWTALGGGKGLNPGAKINHRRGTKRGNHPGSGRTQTPGAL